MGRDVSLSVFAVDEQQDQPVDVGRWVELARNVLEAESVPRPSELSLLFVDEEFMTELNRTHMGGDGPTDVLAFPIDDDPGERGRWPDGGTSGPDRDTDSPDDLPLLLGDVVICPAVAARQAPEHAGTFDDEIALLVVHGILHVLGMDHADPAEEALMTARTNQHLTAFHRQR